MANDLDPLIFDLLEWVERGPRPYAEMIDAWRTSCPRLTVWEDALDRGFLARVSAAGQPARVCLTEAGRDFIASRRGDRRASTSSSKEEVGPAA